RIHSKTMILRGNFHLLCEEILHRVIRPVMPKFQLERFASKRQPAKLMPEANPKDGYLPNKLADCFDSVANRLRIAGSIREKYAVRLYSKCVFRSSLGRNHPNVAIMIHEQPQDVLLDSVIEGKNAVLVTLTLCVRLPHLFRPRRNRHLHRAFLPPI